MDIGLIGAENFHAEHFARVLNAEKRFAGYTATHLYGGDSPEAAARLCAQYGLEACQSEDEVIARCDALVVTYRRGPLHHAAVMKALQAGKPVFNDKPFAASSAEAAEMAAYAEAHGILLCGGSNLKLLPGLEPVRRALETAPTAPEAPRALVEIAFSADPASPYGGYWFYGIHSVELCLALCGNNWQRVAALRDGGLVVATVGYPDCQCIITTRPDLSNIHITVTHGGRAELFQVPLKYESLGPVEFVTMLQTGRPPRPYAFYVQAVRLAEAIAGMIEQP